MESRNNTYVTINITISTVDYTLAKTYFSFPKKCTSEDRNSTKVDYVDVKLPRVFAPK